MTNTQGAEFMLARTGAGRPTLVHRLRSRDRTACGLNTLRWPSRVYLRNKKNDANLVRIMVCRKCGES